MYLRSASNIGRRVRTPSRNLSSLLKVDPASISLGLLKSKLGTSSISNEDLVKLYRKIDSSDVSDKERLLDELLDSTDNFSIYFELNDLKLSNYGISKLIDMNPGRVHNAWDLYKKNSGGNVDSRVLFKVAEKLLTGERCDEGNYTIDSHGMSKLFELLKEIQDIPDEFAKLLILKFSEARALGLLKGVNVSSKQIASVVESERENIDSYSHLRLCQIIFNENPSFLPFESIAFCLSFAKSKERFLFKEANDKEMGLLGDMKNIASTQDASFPHEYSLFMKDLTHYIEANKIDLTDIAESLLVRIGLMEYYGIEMNDFDLCLQKFHQYQTHQKFGLEVVQSKLVKALTFQAIKQKDETLLKIASTLLTEQIPIGSLQGLIVAHSFFDSDRALSLYNEYIPHVSKNLNPKSHRSSSGLLTEAVILAYVANHDREFGQLLLQKAIDNEMVRDEQEIATIRKVIKLHGDAWAEEDKGKADEHFRDYSLGYIASL